MSSNNLISINETNIVITVKTNDVWHLTVINGNFMLSKYNGRGSATVNIISFPNIGDGLFGDIEFSVNNNPCFKGSMDGASGDGKYFNVTPKYVTLKGRGDTYDVSVASDCTGWTITNTNTEYTATKENNSSVKITSTEDASFENISFIVKSCDNVEERVYVSQQPSHSSSNILTVNPQYITLNGNDKNFKVNVISLCSGSTGYTYDGDEGLTLNDVGNVINGTINATEDTTKTFTVRNSCESKIVTVNYTKIEEGTHYMWIKTNGTSAVTDAVFSTVGTVLEYDILSSSNWFIYSYDTSKVRCSKNGNKIKVTLGDDKSACTDYEIILKNRDNDMVKIVYDIAEGLVSESGITFTFEDGKELFTTAVTQTDVTDNISFNICVFCHDGDNNEIEWRVKSSAFSSSTETISGGTSGSCKSVTLTSTPSTKNSMSKDYTIKLQEQETFKEITVKVSITRPANTSSSRYVIDMSPSGGELTYDEVNTFRISVTPTYYFNNNAYYIGNYDVMKTIDGYEGVSAITESKTSGISLTWENDGEAYDTLIYKVSGITTSTTSFEVCTTATKHDGTKVNSASTCYTYTLTAVTEEIDCTFTTGETVIEISGEAITEEVLLHSKQDGEKVLLTYSGVEPWFTVTQDESGESIYINCQENTDFNDRNATLIVKQDGGCSNDTYTIYITQYSNQTIVIPDFDYLVVRYFWKAEAGQDLDTVTVFDSFLDKNGNEMEGVTTSTSSAFFDKGVGYSHGTDIPYGHETWQDENKVISGASGEIYLMHAGDNTQNGNECVFIGFKNVCPDSEIQSMIQKGIFKVRAKLYGSWYYSKGTGKLDVSLLAYKGGTMIDDPNDMYNFQNDGGEQVFSAMTSASVCVKGGSGHAAKYKETYTLIGYVDYNIVNGSAALTLNTECENSSYVLEKTETFTALTIPYSASTTNSICFKSLKDGNSFADVSVSSSLNWLGVFTTTSTTSPFKYTYTVDENDTTDSRQCLITVKQGESNKTIKYQITQLANSATYFSLSETEELTETIYTLGETQTSLKFFVLSCKNYNAGNGNRLGYESSISGCGSSGEKTEEGDYKFWHTFNIPTTCTGGTIVLTQHETNKQMTINFNRTCACVAQDTINAMVLLETSEKYIENGYYYTDLTATATLSQQIACGSATVTVYYGVGSIGNAGQSEIVIPNKSISGTSTIQLGICLVSEYDENKPMDCIKNIREGHVMTFTNNSCYVSGVINVNIVGTSLCEECTCQVTNITMTPTSCKLLTETSEQIFNVNVETSTCESCTKGWKLYDPNGRLVTAGTGENTVKITYNSAVKGEYKLIADDNNEKTAKVNVDKFGAYYEFCVRKAEDAFTTCLTSITLNYSANNPNESYSTITRSRYYTGSSETDFIQIDFTRTTNDNWITLKTDGTWELSVNNTYSERTGTIEFTQNNSGKKCNIIIKQSGLPTSYQLSATSTTIDYDDVEARVSIYSMKNGEPYNQLMFDESCSWLSSPTVQSSNNGTYVYQFTTTPNTNTTERTCTIKVSQENGTDKVDVTVKQKAAPPPPDPCMTISYVVNGGVSSCDVYFKTNNGTQQGSHSNVSSNGNKTLCNIAEGTVLNVSCSCADVTIEGDTSFTFYSGRTASITLKKNEKEPVITGFKIANNQPGSAKIYMKDVYNNVITMKLPNGTTSQSITLANGGAEQTFSDIFTATTTIFIEYEQGQWAKDNFLVVDFEGSNLEPQPTAENNIDIIEQGIEGFIIFPRITGACSGSITCRSHDYYVYVNFIFK